MLTAKALSRYYQINDYFVKSYQWSRTKALIRRLSQAWSASLTGGWFSRDWLGESRAYDLFSRLVAWIDSLLTRLMGTEKERYTINYVGRVMLGLFAVLSLPFLPRDTAVLAFDAALLAGLVLYRSEYGLYAAVLILPFLPFKAAFVLSLFTLVSWFLQVRGGELPRLKFSPTWIPLLLYFLVMFYATVTSISFWTSASEFLIPVTGLIFLFIMVNRLDTLEKLDDFLVVLALAGLIVSSYAIYDYYYGYSILELHKGWVDADLNPELSNRAAAIFDNPNLLAHYFVLLTPLSLAGVFASPKWWRKVVFLLATVTTTTCLMLTYSRGGWIGLAVGLVVFCLLQRPVLTVITLGVGGLTQLPLMTAVMTRLLPASIMNRLVSISSLKDSSNAFRIDTWKGAFALIQDHWPTGVGLGRFAFNRVYATYLVANATVPHSHSLFLELMSEFGIIGTTLFLWLFLRLFRLGLKLRSAASGLIRHYNAGIMAALVGFLTHSTIDYFMWYYKLGVLIWLLVGVVLVLERLNEDNPAKA
ncbi:MAG: hypothetical protein HPY50_07895 [Firmicutes bacterium]|nr:hypothetical protein [Bacillota bacterium]